MRTIFNIDGPVVNFLNKVADLVWLNILFIICSIPIFTIGASTTALFYVTLKMARDEEAYVTKSFFKSFKDNFKQSTLIWLIAVVLGIILLTDFSIINGKLSGMITMSQQVKNVMNILLLLMLGMYVFTVVFVFPLMAKFENTTKNMIRNALLLSCKHFPATLVEIASIAVFTVLVIYIPALFIFVFMMMFSLIAYISSQMYVKVFDKYIPQEEKESEEDILESEETEEHIIMQ